MVSAAPGNTPAPVARDGNGLQNSCWCLAPVLRPMKGQESLAQPRVGACLAPVIRPRRARLEAGGAVGFPIVLELELVLVLAL
jgi:hypothetical protein